jgi:putative transposase
MTHRKQVRHYHTPGGLHEFTFSCYHRRPLLTRDDWCEKLARSLDEAGDEQQIDLVAFVFMPEHLHRLVYPRLPEPNLGLYLARIKQPFSVQIKEVLTCENSPLLPTLMVRERPRKTCFRFWQEGPGFDRNLNTPQSVQAAIEYIHLNPVRRGLYARAIDWKWSSARYYLLDPPRQQFVGLPHIHGPPVGMLD